MPLDPPAIAETDETTPAPAPAAGERVCPNCSETFLVPLKGPGGHKRYCSDTCRNAWGNREKALGAVIVTVARIWAQNRKSGEVGNKAFARLREALDLMNETDATEGKRLRLKAGGPLDRYINEVLAEPYLDRKRR